MECDYVENEELLYRAITEKQKNAYFEGRVLPSLFIDADGLSVDRDGNREERMIISNMETRFKKQGYVASAKIKADACRKADTYPVPSPTKNIFHALILDSKEKAEISLLKAVKLAHMCTVVE